MRSVQPELFDFPIDVCISYPDDRGVREKHFFQRSRALVETLAAWHQRGVRGIMLTWGTTTAVNRRAVEAVLRRSGVQYSVPSRARPSGAPRLYLLIGAILLLLGPVLFIAADLWGHNLYTRFFPMPDDPVAFENWLQSKRRTVIAAGVGAAALSMSAAAFFLRRIRRIR